MTSRWPCHEEDRSGPCYEANKLKRTVEREGLREVIREEKEYNLFLLMASVVSVSAEFIPL